MNSAVVVTAREAQLQKLQRLDRNALAAAKVSGAAFVAHLRDVQIADTLPASIREKASALVAAINSAMEAIQALEQPSDG